MITDIREEDWGVDWDIDDPEQHRWRYAVQDRYITLRSSFYDSYGYREEIDAKLLQNHIDKCNARRDAALSIICTSVDDIPSLLDIHLPLLSDSNNHLQTLNIYNVETDQNGTLFGEEVSESLEGEEDDDDETFRPYEEGGVVYDQTNAGITISWKSRPNPPAMNRDKITESLWQIINRRPIAFSDKEEWYSEALYEYGLVLTDKRYRFKDDNFIVKMVVNRVTDNYRKSQAKKRKEVEKDLTNNFDTVPQEWIEVEHDTYDQEFSHLSLTQKKALMDFKRWNDDAPIGEKPPKAMRQRLKRVPKLEYKESATRYGPKPNRIPQHGPVGDRVRGLRDHWHEEFPVQVRTVAVTDESKRKYERDWSRCGTGESLEQYVIRQQALETELNW